MATDHRRCSVQHPTRLPDTYSRLKEDYAAEEAMEPAAGGRIPDGLEGLRSLGDGEDLEPTRAAIFSGGRMRSNAYDGHHAYPTRGYAAYNL